MLSIRSIRSLVFAFGTFALVMLAMPAPAAAQFGIGVSITIGPPELPVYEQPVIPGAGFIWTPGFWAWGDDDYYWVPGTWVQPPEAGLLWTPGYWAWEDGVFIGHAGYWGPQIGFYGGINYGFGYGGVGYEGGYWQNGAFFYNRSVNNVSNVTTITNVYNKTVVNNVTVNNVSYNGGNGGVTAKPTAVEVAAAQQRHVPPTGEQTQHIQLATKNPVLKASENHGKPPIAATPKPGVFSGGGVVPAKAAAPYHPPTPAAGAKSTNPAGGQNRSPMTAHPAPPNDRSAPAPKTERAVPPDNKNRPAPPKTNAPPERGAPPERQSAPPPKPPAHPTEEKQATPPPKAEPKPPASRQEKPPKDDKQPPN